MFERDLIRQIKEEYKEYTKAEKKVADFVLNNPEKVLFMSISDLADVCQVGDTSVFRFCRRLNLQGYQEFKMKLSFSVHIGEDTTEELGEVHLNDSFEVMAKKMLQNNLNAINETYSLINTQEFEKAMGIIQQANHIHFFGVGTSMLTAMVAMNQFLRITPNVHCLPDSHMQAMAASMLTPEDVAIVISYSGATKDTIHVAKQAKQAGAKVICMTRFEKSPLTAYSDVTIRCGSKEGPLEGGSTSSQMSQMFLIDLMYMDFYKRKFEINAKNRHKTAGAVVEKIY